MSFSEFQMLMYYILLVGTTNVDEFQFTREMLGEIVGCLPYLVYFIFVLIELNSNKEEFAKTALEIESLLISSFFFGNFTNWILSVLSSNM